jgi:hypothetical protein
VTASGPVVEALGNATLRKVAIGVHLFIAGWMLLNGVGHQIQVLWKAQHGTLKPEANVTSLLVVGAALLAVSAVFSVTAWPLTRAQVWPALAALGFFVAVIAGIAYEYGFTFLAGSIVLASLDLIAVSVFALSR